MNQSLTKDQIIKIITDRLTGAIPKMFLKTNTPVATRTETRKTYRQQQLRHQQRFVRPKEIVVAAPIGISRIIGKLKWSYVASTGIQSGYYFYYNGGTTSSLTQNMNLMYFNTIAFSKPNIARMKSLYDKYRLNAISIKYTNAGTLTQSDDTDSSILSPISIGISQSGNTFDYPQIAGLKPSIFLCNQPRELWYHGPKPNVYFDCDETFHTYDPVYLVMQPSDDKASTAEYYFQLTYYFQFTKQELKYSTYPSLI